MDYKRQFVKEFENLCYSRQRWQVWNDVITMIAYTLANNNCQIDDEYYAREKEYLECVKRIGDPKPAAKLMALIVEALDDNPKQDFIGQLFMELELSSHWLGQFFTPYNLCEAMARLTIADKQEVIGEKGWASVHDCAAGAGATLIGAANAFKEIGINYQKDVLFIAQEIDKTTALMCYIQLSLLGCPGYVVIGNTLTNPLKCRNNVLFPIKQDEQQILYTPMFNSNIWAFRRLFNAMDRLTESNIKLEKHDDIKIIKEEKQIGQISMF